MHVLLSGRCVFILQFLPIYHLHSLRAKGVAQWMHCIHSILLHLFPLTSLPCHLMFPLTPLPCHQMFLLIPLLRHQMFPLTPVPRHQINFPLTPLPRHQISSSLPYPVIRFSPHAPFPSSDVSPSSPYPFIRFPSLTPSLSYSSSDVFPSFPIPSSNVPPHSPTPSSEVLVSQSVKLSVLRGVVRYGPGGCYGGVHLPVFSDDDSVCLFLRNPLFHHARATLLSKLQSQHCLLHRRFDTAVACASLVSIKTTDRLFCKQSWCSTTTVSR